jgi:hypothetical protein
MQQRNLILNKNDHAEILSKTNQDYYSPGFELEHGQASFKLLFASDAGWFVQGCPRGPFGDQLRALVTSADCPAAYLGPISGASAQSTT